MSAYKNFTVDLPERIQRLDVDFRPIAKRQNLEFSYLLMKLAATFLLPHERVSGTSGAARYDVSDAQRIRKVLEFDKKFCQSTYCKDWNRWFRYSVSDFSRGPTGWIGGESSLPSDSVAEVLVSIRHALAHSNLYFGGEKQIEHVFFGSRLGRPPTDNYTVVRCDESNLNHFLDSWLSNVRKLRASPYLIWAELERAA